MTTAPAENRESFSFMSEINGPPVTAATLCILSRLQEGRREDIVLCFNYWHHTPVIPTVAFMAEIRDELISGVANNGLQWLVCLFVFLVAVIL